MMTKIFQQKIKSALVCSLVLFLLSNLFMPFSIGFGQKQIALAQGIGNFVPRYPQRLIYVAEEIQEASTYLTYLNKKLAELVNECDFKNATSQVQRQDTENFKAGDPEAFGECCPRRMEIEKTQNQIIIKVNQLSYLKTLIQKEMDFGLDAELKTLREAEGKKLEINLNNLLGFIDKDAVENILTVALENSDIIDDDMYSVEKKKGIARWTKDIALKLMVCLLGEQEPIEMKFNVGLGIEDLDLGELRIEKFGLNLPEKIKLSDIADFDDYVIPAPEINIDFPAVNKLEDLHIDSIALQPSSVGVPGIAPISFSCAQVSSQAKQNIKEGKDSDHYIDVNWYLKTFSWLSEQCQTMPELRNQTPESGNQEVPNPFCFDQENVHKSIVSACDQEWQEYYDCIDIGAWTCDKPVAFCFDLGMSGRLERHKAYQRECLNLNPSDANCVLNIECDIDEMNCEATPQSINRVLNALENKCSELKQNREAETPTPCKFLPLFTREFKEPNPDYFQDTASVPSHTVSDSSGIKVGVNCPVSASALPKLELPDIIIPDIQLPVFNFSPFLKVHLPNFIFEDLITPDLELCNLDGCKNLIPDIMVDFAFPNLRLPEIKIPALPIDIPDLPAVKPNLEINNLAMPSVQIPLPEFNLTDFITPEFELPKINMPGPKVTMEFAGLEIDMLNVILGLVQSLLELPTGCWSLEFINIPLVIAFPDYYFYWPRFPEFPDLCNNKYININDFCKDIKNALDFSALDEIAKIQSSVNQATQNLQIILDRIATKIETIIRTEVHQQLAAMRTEIQNKINSSIQHATLENGKIKIPSAYIPLNDIIVPMDEVNAELRKIPKEIDIPWAAELNNGITLDRPIVQKLPPIPLSDLGYQKEVIIKIPGFQKASFDFNIGIAGYLGFEGQSPSSGNPYPIGTINANVGKITSIHNNISIATQNIVEVLK